MSYEPAELFPTPCVLCGSETERTVIALVEWAEPVGKEVWDDVPRCADRAGCRRRVELDLGQRWPVNDRTPAPPIALPGERLAKAAEPEPQPEDQPAVVASTEEVISWLS